MLVVSFGSRLWGLGRMTEGRGSRIEGVWRGVLGLGRVCFRVRRPKSLLMVNGAIGSRFQGPCCKVWGLGFRGLHTETTLDDRWSDWHEDCSWDDAQRHADEDEGITGCVAAHDSVLEQSCAASLLEERK